MAKGDLEFYASLSVALSVPCLVRTSQREQAVGPFLFAGELSIDIGQPPE